MGKWDSRKLMLSLVVFSVATGLVWFGKIAEGAWMTVTGATVLAYLAANVVDKKFGGNG